MRIVKIEDNRYKVTFTKMIEGADGQEVEVYDEDNAVFYGLDKARNELQTLQFRKDKLEEPDALQNMIDELNAQIVQTEEIVEAIEMDGAE